MKTYLITDCAGFIGSHIADNLCSIISNNCQVPIFLNLLML